MRIVFMGTPEFAIPSLKILLDNNYSVINAVTVPDKPVGRGQHVSFSPIKDFALQNQLPLLQPVSLKDPTFLDHLKSLEPDLFIVVAFRILPSEVFRIPKRGAFNLHASLLPKYRGAAPINWAIINGEKETGVTTFFLTDKVDTGKIILQARVPIRDDDTAGDLHDKLADIGAEIVLHTVRLIELGKAISKSQDEKQVSPAPKIFKEHCKIDWMRSANELHNFVRGLSPKPTAFTSHKETLVKIYRTKIHSSLCSTLPGEILQADQQLIVSTGNGAIEILELQQEGKKKLSADEFLRGFRLKNGEKFT
jgi:methionyl-tRNA formyltransferase